MYVMDNIVTTFYEYYMDVESDRCLIPLDFLWDSKIQYFIAFIPLMMFGWLLPVYVKLCKCLCLNAFCYKSLVNHCYKITFGECDLGTSITNGMTMFLNALMIDAR